MKLLELFDKKLDFEHLKYSNSDVYLFSIPDLEKKLEVSVDYVSDNTYEMTFSIAGNFNLTKYNKSQFYIFSAVVQTLKSWFEKHPDTIVFLQGFNKTQHRFYERFFPSAMKGYKVDLSYTHEEYPEEKLISISKK